jgi:hypothetical protein
MELIGIEASETDSYLDASGSVFTPAVVDGI